METRAHTHCKQVWKKTHTHIKNIERNRKKKLVKKSHCFSTQSLSIRTQWLELCREWWFRFTIEKHISAFSIGLNLHLRKPYSKCTTHYVYVWISNSKQAFSTNPSTPAHIVIYHYFSVLSVYTFFLIQSTLQFVLESTSSLLKKHGLCTYPLDSNWRDLLPLLFLYFSLQALSVDFHYKNSHYILVFVRQVSWCVSKFVCVCVFHH